MKSVLLVALSFVSLSTSAWTKVQLDQAEDLYREFDRRERLVGSALSVWSPSQGAVHWSDGFADHARSLALTPQSTSIRWASLSKGMTGAIAAQAADRGEIDLDADIRDYFTTYPMPSEWVRQANNGQWVRRPLPAGSKITLRLLLGNIAGVQAYSNGLANPTPPARFANDPSVNTGLEWALSYWINAPLIAVPGQRYSYTTMGFNLAAVVLEKALGRPFADLIRDRIAQPFGATSIQPDYAWVNIPGRSDGFARRSRSARATRDPDTDVSWKLGGGGLTSTPADLSLYCQRLATDGLTPSAKALLWQKQRLNSGREIDYGMGWAVQNKRLGRLLSHDGHQPKTRTRIAIYETNSGPVCITFMTNTRTKGMNIGHLTKGVASALLGHAATQDVNPAQVQGENRRSN